jgi:hypothetical protein
MKMLRPLEEQMRHANGRWRWTPAYSVSRPHSMLLTWKLLR